MNKLYYLPKGYLSYSQLQSFTNCSFSFYLHYYLDTKSVEKERVVFGKKFQDLLNTKYRNEDIINELDGFGKGDKRLAKKLIAKAKDFEDIIHIDEQFKVDLGFDIPILFAPDLLTKKYLIENKTSKGYYNRRTVQHQPQILLYYVGVRKLFGFDPEIYYQIFNVIKENMDFVKVNKNIHDIDMIMEWIKMVLGQIKKCYDSKEWVIGGHSKFPCNFSNICPIYNR